MRGMSVVTEYIDRLSGPENIALTKLRSLVYEIVPTAEDAYSYGVPTYRYKGKYLLAFAANKKFMSIYPGADAISVFKKELEQFKTSKGTISFTPDNLLPDELVRNIVHLCKDTIDQKVK